MTTPNRPPLSPAALVSGLQKMAGLKIARRVFTGCHQPARNK